MGDVYEQLWQLIVRLNANSQRYIRLLQDIYHKENIRLSVEQWIDQSVISQCLFQQLRCATNDNDLLPHYYYSKCSILTSGMSIFFYLNYLFSAVRNKQFVRWSTSKMK